MSACITYIARITQVTLKTVNNTLLIYNCCLCFLHIYSCSIFRLTNTVMTTPKRRIISFAFSVLYLILASFYLFNTRAQAIGHRYYVSFARKWSNCAIIPMRPLRTSYALFPRQLKRSLEEIKRLGLFNNFCRNVRKDYFDRIFKVNSALKSIFSVIEDQCRGGQRSSK